VALLTASGQSAVVDLAQGLDFATWMPISLMYPSGKVPTVQVSLPVGGSPEEMIAVGKALAPLRHQGIVLVGTGAIVCNPSRERHDNTEAPAESGISRSAFLRARVQLAG
jgi:4,5-DOPA dioxygenase extradiol